MEAETHDEQIEIDRIDSDSFHDEAMSAIKSLGIPEDEAENFLEDLGY